jgi:hypothetical protein
MQALTACVKDVHSKRIPENYVSKLLGRNYKQLGVPYDEI